jgi:nicotine blue oxidoreductase
VSVAGLLLAAGGGRRFGSPKALVEHGDELLVERGSRLLLSSGLEPVVVVVGAGAGEVSRRARLGTDGGG